MNIKALVMELSNQYPFLTRREIIAKIVHESIDELPTIIGNLSLPDPKAVKIRRRYKLRRMQEKYRDKQVEQFNKEDDKIGLYYKLQRVYQHRVNNDDIDKLNENQGMYVVNDNIDSIDHLEFDGSSLHHASTSSLKKTETIFENREVENKWIDQINKKIDIRLKNQNSPLQSSIQSIFGLISEPIEPESHD